MGGFGALHLAINYQDVFGAAGAMSAGVDLRPFSGDFGIDKILRPFANHPKRYDELAIINNLHKIAAGNNVWREKPNHLPIIIYIGVSDFFLPMNRKLHQTMLDMRIEHDYIERSGGHEWSYWDNAIVYQFQFLTDHMQKQN